MGLVAHSTSLMFPSVSRRFTRPDALLFQPWAGRLRSLLLQVCLAHCLPLHHLDLDRINLSFIVLIPKKDVAPQEELDTFLSITKVDVHNGAATSFWKDNCFLVVLFSFPTMPSSPTLSGPRFLKFSRAGLICVCDPG